MLVRILAPLRSTSSCRCWLLLPVNVDAGSRSSGAGSSLWVPAPLVRDLDCVSAPSSRFPIIVEGRE